MYQKRQYFHTGLQATATNYVRTAAFFKARLPCKCHAIILKSSQKQMGYFDTFQKVPKSTQCCIEPQKSNGLH